MIYGAAAGIRTQATAIAFHALKGNLKAEISRSCNEFTSLGEQGMLALFFFLFGVSVIYECEIEKIL